MRTFETGALRDSDQGKLDYEGFLNPEVLEAFAEYMHKHRHLPDGTLRDSDNWQKGIPQAELVKSLLRHVMTVWKAHRMGALMPKDELCAIMFNTQGLLLNEIMTNKLWENMP